MIGEKETDIQDPETQGSDAFNLGRPNSLSAHLSFNASASAQGRFLLQLTLVTLLTLTVLFTSLRLTLGPGTPNDFPSCPRLLAEAAPRGGAPAVHVSQKLVHVLENREHTDAALSALKQAETQKQAESFFSPRQGSVRQRQISLDPLTDYLARKTRVWGDSCGYSEDKVLQILGKPHGARRGERRFFTRDQWMDIDELLKAVEWHRRRHVAYGETVCILAHLWGTVPCAETPCLVPMHVRPHFTDISTLKQLVERGDFDFLYSYNFTTILDAGANVGFASLIFGIQFPDSRIISVELSPENFRVLRKNTGFLPNVTPVNAGLHNSIQTLSFSHEAQKGKRLGWGYRLQTEGVGGEGEEPRNEESSAPGRRGETGQEGNRTREEKAGTTPIKTVTMDLVMQLFDLPSIDFIKVDVEGSEKEIFTEDKGQGYSPYMWIERSKLLAIETHDRVKNGSSQAVEEAMKQHEQFVQTKVGEYLTYFDQEQIAHPLKHAWRPK